MYHILGGFFLYIYNRPAVYLIKFLINGEDTFVVIIQEADRSLVMKITIILTEIYKNGDWRNDTVTSSLKLAAAFKFNDA